MVDIEKLIAAISPEVYCDSEVRDEVKKLVKEKGYRAGAEKAKFVKYKEIIIEDAKMNPLDKKGLKTPFESHKLIYDSMAESLEPIYFWILDFISKLYKDVDKVSDNFVASPGSGYFSELGQKATAMQDKAMSMLGTVNTVLKSILNVLYDLKEFKLRLDLYDDIKSKETEKRNGAVYALKQIWMDSVDIKRGTTSIKGLMQQLDYVTVIDAFMIAEDEESAEKLDLNDRVKRIVKQRVGEFRRWVIESELEMRKRFEIEKRYLRSQYNTIQLYSRWIAPYLKAANKLEQNAKATAGLVNTFNTLMLELTLLARSPYDPKDDVDAKNLPKRFETINARKYYSVLVIDFKFRGVPQRVGQGYSYGGKTDVIFTAYSLNEEEIKVLKEEIEKDNFGDVLSLIEGATKESLEQIKGDIEGFLEPKKEMKEEKSDDTDSNPFTALFSGIGSIFKNEKKDNKEKKDLSKGIEKDDEFEKIIRSQAIIDAIDKCRNVFDIYKKSHQMPSWP